MTSAPHEHPSRPPVDLRLTLDEQSMLDGEQGDGLAMAMRVVVGLARVHEAPRLVEIESAHIDGCLFHGQSGLDFASRLVGLGATVRVPTTLNVGSIDLLHPSTVRNQTRPSRRSASAAEHSWRPTWPWGRARPGPVPRTSSTPGLAWG